MRNPSTNDISRRFYDHIEPALSPQILRQILSDRIDPIKSPYRQPLSSTQFGRLFAVGWLFDLGWGMWYFGVRQFVRELVFLGDSLPTFFEVGFGTVENRFNKLKGLAKSFFKSGFL